MSKRSLALFATGAGHSEAVCETEGTVSNTSLIRAALADALVNVTAKLAVTTNASKICER